MARKPARAPSGGGRLSQDLSRSGLDCFAFARQPSKSPRACPIVSAQYLQFSAPRDRPHPGERNGAELASKGATLRATEQPIDTGTAAGKCFLDMLGVFAEFETNLRKERQLEGIAKAKAAGVYKGRPASIDRAQIQQLKAQGMGPSQIAKQLGIGGASVYRALEA